MNTTGFVPQANRITVGDVYGRKVIVGNQNSVRPDEIYAEVDEHTNLTKVVDANRTLVPGGGGTSDYADLENKPKINGTELNGDLSAEDLGLQDSINVNQGGTTSSTPELSDININGTQYAISKPYINETIPQFSFTAKLNTIRIPGNSVYYTVPAISTNITTDYNSDSKTASPKSVKEFVEGKGYYIKPQTGIPASDLASGVIPTVPVQDVTVGGTSVVSNGTAVISQEVFWATYGTTTRAEIDAAVAAGKLCLAPIPWQTDFNLIGVLSRTSAYHFSCIYLGAEYASIVSANGTWGTKRTILQTSAIVQTISGYETNGTKYPSTKAVADALGKWGVVSQTQTWSGTGTQPRTYVMSDLVYGTIPQANIDLFESAGATFNATSGYFELNGLTDISYEEMQKIYNKGEMLPPDGTTMYNFIGVNTRTLLPFNTLSSLGALGRYNILSSFRNTSLEVLKFVDFETVATTNSINYAFENSQKLRSIFPILNMATNATPSTANAFKGCFSLESVKINTSVDVSFYQSPALTLDSVVYIVQNAVNTSAITITLHADAYARCQADTTEYTYNGNTYTGILALATAHNITIASA